jgi:uncharacterized membrane protein
LVVGARAAEGSAAAAGASVAAAPRDGGDMSLARILRHLVSSRLSVRRAFPSEALRAIERAVRETEATHEGEIVFVVEPALETLPLLRGQTARERALEVFSRLRVWDTEHNNGVLVYILMADRAVEILADRGIHVRAGRETWQEVCREMEAAFRRRDYLPGALAGIRAVGRHLAKHFGSAGTRRNELPDAPIAP